MSQEKRLLELVVHTPTLEQLQEVVKISKDRGYAVPDINLEKIFRENKENTCIFISKEHWSIMSSSWYRKSGYNIILFFEFMDLHICKPVNDPGIEQQTDWIKELEEKIKTCAEKGELGVLAGQRFAQMVTNSFNRIEHFSKVQYENRIKDLERKLESEINTRIQLEKDYNDIVNECERLENLPKAGDVCLFWDDYTGLYVLGLMESNGGVKGVGKYDHCIKATDENIKLKIKELRGE